MKISLLSILVIKYELKVAILFKIVQWESEILDEILIKRSKDLKNDIVTHLMDSESLERCWR